MTGSRINRQTHHRLRGPLVAAALTATAFLALATSAAAQASRTWVSGVGDDANPCSRTAPCKTFAGAILKTAAGGIIDALDPGSFGPVTITQSITLDGGGNLASVLAAGTDGIDINGTGITVVLRNLTIEGTETGLAGVNVIAARRVHLENTVIDGFTNGIDFEPSASLTRLTVNNSSVYDDSNDGIKIAAGTTGTSGSLNQANVTNTSIEENANNGVEVTAPGTYKAGLNLFGDEIIDNGTLSTTSPTTNNAILSNGARATVRISRNDIAGSLMGLQEQNGGAILSWGDNDIFNAVNGAPTGMLTPG